MTQLSQDNLVEFFNRYCSEEIGRLAREYPNDSQSFWIDYADMVSFNPTLADDMQADPERTIDELERSLTLVDLPYDITLSDVTVRVYNVEEEFTYSPGEIRTDQSGKYVAIQGILERVTTESEIPDVVAFECMECHVRTTIPQSGQSSGIQKPYTCDSCDRQGPFEIDHEQSEWDDYVRLRVQSRPDTDASREGKIAGFAINDLIDVGGDQGLIGRVGEPVTVSGIIRRVQKSGRGENEMLFDHQLEAKAIEFDRDEDTVDVEEHREEFKELAAREDAVDLFAESIAPQLHTTDEWDAAMEFGVAYLFAAPRIDLPNGPTYRGDLHFLIVSDYGMGKSTFKEDIEAYSPKCISKSTTALSSGVGLTAAAVKDDFGEGQWTIKPGLLVRANGGHLILDEIDKGPDQLTDMNDALEGEQVVDIEKAGQSATYQSRTGVMALGNPQEGRFNQYDSTAEQIGIADSLLSRFDGIVTMEDGVDAEQDAAIAETYGKSFTEAQSAEFGDLEEFDALDRPVPIDVGQAWVKYAREEVNPVLDYEQFEELEDWYANEVRQLNETYGESDGEGSDMAVPATVRELASAVKMSIAFARAELCETVQPRHIERAKRLGIKLVGQNYDEESGEFSATSKFNNSKRSWTQEERHDRIKKIVDKLEDSHEEGVPEEKVVKECTRSGMDESNAEHDLDSLKETGELYCPGSDLVRTI